MLILTFLCMIQLTFAIYSTDICYLNNSGCNHEAKTNEAKCKQNKCEFMYPYIHECGRDKCSKNGSDCDEFILLSRHFSARLFRTNIGLTILPVQVQELIKEREMNFKKFQSKIKSCSRVKTSVLRSQDVCLKRKKCYTLDSNKSEIKRQKYKKLDCPCDGRNGYECGKDYCTPNKYICELLNQAFQMNTEFVDSIKKCSFIDF